MAEEGLPILRPGMDHVVHAGETLVIRDREGEEFSVTGREGDTTMQFLSAFDTYKDAVAVGNLQHRELDLLWQQCLATFMALPIRIHSQMPSLSKLGIRA